MSKSKRFEPIHAMAANSALDLSRAMSEAGRKVTDLEQQFERLRAYRNEYAGAATPGDGGSMEAVKLQNYQSFLVRLGDALRQQQVSLEKARADYDKRRAVWSEKRIEAESLHRAIGRYRQEEQSSAERREQRAGDEAAARISLNTRDR